MSNEAARPVSVNIGRPKALTHRGKHVPNGVFETPLEGTLRMDRSSSKEALRPTSAPTVIVGGSIWPIGSLRESKVGSAATLKAARKAESLTAGERRERDEQ